VFTHYIGFVAEFSFFFSGHNINATRKRKKYWPLKKFRTSSEPNFRWKTWSLRPI